MFPMTILQWFFRGEWYEIGWRAGTPKSTEDLRAHGERLAQMGGRYRLVHSSIYSDGPVEVVHEFAVVGAGTYREE